MQTDSAATSYTSTIFSGISGGILSGMVGRMGSLVKTSVTLPENDVRLARQLNINLSELVREALRSRLREEQMTAEVDSYVAAFAEWDETDWDHLAGDGIAELELKTVPKGRRKAAQSVPGAK